MSQHHSPYIPPDLNYYATAVSAQAMDPEYHLLASARRAGMLMIVLGCLMLICGSCSVGFSRLPLENMVSQEQMAAFQKALPRGATLAQMYMAGGIIGLAFGVAALLLGIFVRRGKYGAIVASIVLAGLVVAYLLLNLLGTAASAAGPAMLIAGLAVTAIPGGIMVLLLTWLLQARRASIAAAGLRQAYAAQLAPCEQRRQQ